MKRTLLAALAVVCVGGVAMWSQGCTSGPFYTAAKKKIDAERAAFDAEINDVQTKIYAEIDKEREEARELTEKRDEIEKEFAHATVEHQYGLRAVDQALSFNIEATNVNISRFDQTLKSIEARRKVAEVDWAEREATARSADAWVERAVGAGITAIPGAGGMLAVGLWQSRRATSRTAAEFRDVIAAGRSEEEVDRIVTGNTALGRALRSLMARRPDIAKTVEKDGLHKPVVNAAEVSA